VDVEEHEKAILIILDYYCSVPSQGL